MNLIKKWNEYMGPKDERLEASENKAVRVSGYILLVGALVSLYYGIMVEQVAFTTDRPVLTSLGESVVPMSWPLTLTILVAGIVSIAMNTRAGFFSTRKRYAEVDHIPWDFVVMVATACGAVLGLLTGGLRILAEIQIVGIENVAWFGDAAIAVVYFAIGFVLGFVLFTLSIHDAIKRRQQLERDLES